MCWGVRLDALWAHRPAVAQDLGRRLVQQRPAGYPDGVVRQGGPLRVRRRVALQAHDAPEVEPPAPGRDLSIALRRVDAADEFTDGSLGEKDGRASPTPGCVPVARQGRRRGLRQQGYAPGRRMLATSRGLNVYAPPARLMTSRSRASVRPSSRRQSNASRVLLMAHGSAVTGMTTRSDNSIAVRVVSFRPGAVSTTHGGCGPTVVRRPRTPRGDKASAASGADGEATT